MKAKLLEIAGWIGSIALSLSAAPQALKSIQDGHSNGIAGGMLALWSVGVICSLVYIWPKRQVPLIVNYVLSFIFMSIILWYK